MGTIATLLSFAIFTSSGIIERSAISIDCDPTRGVFDIVREGNKEIVVLHTNSFRGETFKFNLYVDNIVGRFKTKVIIDPVIVNDGTGEA